ncbi:hypothetical protein CVD28_02435 [Bacillus sp. M6-12]|uniref:hypothetical protein n=1 Tax=Bacillus sp. M6-12 TaxID=2054166 RepID=UPI000C7859F2|nr:hypothetical protein [Bacillus sp. M6-12]PLS19290.1 hypothetical protein CVD28_02435 [Bacillus sp. M6-12]
MNNELNEMFIEMITTRIIVDVLEGERETRLIPCEELELKVHEGMSYLTLQDISEQIQKKFGKEVIIDVWEETGLNGYIYRYGGYGDYWVKHGTTRGFA